MDDNQLADAAYEAKVKDDWDQWWERNDGQRLKREATFYIVGFSLLVAVLYVTAKVV